MSHRRKIIYNINTMWHNLKYTHFIGLYYAHSILLPHNVIKHLFSQETNEIEQEMINEHYRV
jgi:hypothetical protein